MYYFCQNWLNKSKCKYTVPILAILCLIGLFLGACFQSVFRSVSIPLIHATVSCSVHFADLLCSNLIAVLILIITLFCFSSLIGYLFFLLRAFGFGFILTGVLFCFESSGWLLAFLLLLNAGIVNCILFFLFLSSQFHVKKDFIYSIFVSIGTAIGVSVFDFLCIAPFLAHVMHHI